MYFLQSHIFTHLWGGHWRTKEFLFFKAVELRQVVFFILGGSTHSFEGKEQGSGGCNLQVSCSTPFANEWIAYSDLGCLGYIFHRTENLPQLCQNSGILGAEGGSTPEHPPPHPLQWVGSAGWWKLVPCFDWRMLWNKVKYDAQHCCCDLTVFWWVNLLGYWIVCPGETDGLIRDPSLKTFFTLYFENGVYMLAALMFPC
jgi:hypothetical protein